MVTLEDYKKAVLTRYEEVKNEEFSEFLSQPTPAKFKNLSLLLLSGLNATDKNIFNIFFKTENTTQKCIEDFDNDKFRPLRNFVIGKSNLSRQESIDLIAVFINLDSRPYNKFRTAKVTSEEAENELQTEVYISEENTDNRNENETITNSTLNLDPESKDTGITIVPQKLLIIPNSNRNIWTNRIKFILFFFLIAVIGTYLVKGDLFKEKGCMMWMKDHYEEVDCNTKAVHSFYSAPIIALDRETLKYLKKVTVSDTTTFFNPDETPRIWYGKSANKELEYFTYFGQHPETGKELRRISHHMINNHIKNTK